MQKIKKEIQKVHKHKNKTQNANVNCKTNSEN